MLRVKSLDFWAWGFAAKSFEGLAYIYIYIYIFMCLFMARGLLDPHHDHSFHGLLLVLSLHAWGLVASIVVSHHGLDKHKARSIYARSQDTEFPYTPNPNP